MILPLLATQILWINLITDSAPALALGVDTEITNSMNRPPRSPSEHILGRATLLRVGIIGSVMAAATLLAMDSQLSGGILPGDGTVELARTAGFTTLTLAQLFDAFNSRSASASAFRRPFSNPWLWAAAGMGLVLQVAVVQLPILHAAFGTVSMSVETWLLCVALASSVLWCSEAMKLLVRVTGTRGSRRRPRPGARPRDGRPTMFRSYDGGERRGPTPNARNDDTTPATTSAATAAT